MGVLRNWGLCGGWEGGSVPWARAKEKNFASSSRPLLSGCERGKNNVKLRYFGSYCVKGCAV